MVELLERERERAELGSLLTSAQEGKGGIALIEGPAGIGKTHLLSAIRESAVGLGFRTVTARGGELERDFPYGLIRQLFTSTVARPDREELLSGQAARAAAVFSSDVEVAMPETSYSVLQGLFWLTWNLAERTPLLLACDDIQWSDPASARFLTYLARRIEEMPVALVATVRTDEPAGATDFSDELAQDIETRILRLAPLSRAAVNSMVLETLAPDTGQAVADRVYEVTRGNPFLIRELLGELQDDALDPEELRDRLERAAPQRVARHVLKRLKRLGADALELARAVAILGEHGEPSSAAALAGLDEAVANGCADELSRSRILDPGVPLRFVHPLVRSTIYEDIPETERIAAHRLAAQLISEAGGLVEDASLHLLGTPPEADQWVTDTLMAAGRSALGRGAPESAARYLTRAVAEPPEASKRAEALLELGSAEARAGLSTALDHLADAFEAAEDPGLLMRAAIELGIALVFSARFEEAGNVHERALARLGTEDPQMMRIIEGALLVNVHSSVATRRVLLPRLRQVASEVRAGANDVPNHVLSCLALDLALRSGPATEAIAVAERAWGGGDMLRAFGPAFPGISFAPAAMAFAGRPGIAEIWLTEAMDEASRIGSAWGFALASATRAMTRLVMGNLDGAEADARAFLELDVEAQISVLTPLAAAAIVEVLIEKGLGSEAWHVLTTNRLGEDEPRTGIECRLQLARCRLLLSEGRAAEALDEAIACGKQAALFEYDNGGWLNWRCLAGLAHAMSGNEDAARAVMAEQLDLAREFGGQLVVGVSLNTAALVERDERRIELLQESVDILESSEHHLAYANALVDLGAAMRRSGQSRAARTPLQLGLNEGLRCGATVLVGKAHEELLASGARPRRRVSIGPDALTPSEARIARLAAGGMTNRDIGQQLFVTPKTVEAHLRSVFRKLDIQSRVQLADKLGEPDQDFATRGAR